MPSPRELLTFLLLALMEALAGFALVIGSSLLDAIPLGYATFWLLLAAIAAGAVVAPSVARLGLRRQWPRVALLVAGIVVTAALARLGAGDPVGFVAAALIVAIGYWRGLVLTSEPPSYREVQRRFGMGLAVLLLGILWVMARGIVYSGPTWHLLALVGVGYLVTGLAALVTERTERTRERGAGMAVALAVLIQLSLLVGISFVALLFFAHDIAGWLGHLTQPVQNAVGSVLGGFFGLLFGPLTWMIDVLRPHPHHPHPYTAPSGPVQPHGNGKQLHAPPPDNTPAMIVGLVVGTLAVGALSVLIWRVLSVLSRPATHQGYTEERTWLPPSEIWRTIQEWLARLFHRGSALAAGTVSDVRRRVLGPVYPADPVRGLYARLLYRAETAGVPRPVAVTPDEYGRLLASRWPQAAGDVAALTQAYVLRRYADQPFAEEEIAGLRSHWHGVRGVIRREKVPRQKAEPAPDAPIAEKESFLSGLIGPGSMIRTLAIESTVSLAAVVIFFLLLVGLIAGLVVMRSLQSHHVPAGRAGALVTRVDTSLSADRNYNQWSNLLL